MRNVDIDIFPIAKTQVDREAVRRWLDFVGANNYEIPSEETVTDPALLVALAAKRCYKSFEAGLNPNVTKVRKDTAEYLDNVLKQGHGSVLEHAVYTFAIENVSRVFTAEMNRHRAGVGISEGSMRYIRYNDIPWCMPESMTLTLEEHRAFDKFMAPLPEAKRLISFWASTEGPEDEQCAGSFLLLSRTETDHFLLAKKKLLTQAVFFRHFNQTETNYAELQDIWKDELAPESKFHGKKQVTSMIRRIIPMGVATGGVWCYTPETEVLTACGWVRVGLLNAGDTLLTKSPKTGRVRWAKNLNSHSFDYIGSLYRWQGSEDKSPGMTENHTMWAAKFPGGRRETRKASTVMAQFQSRHKVQDLFGSRFVVQNSIGCIDGSHDPSIIYVGDRQYPAEEFFEWLGWVASDGSIAASNRSCVRVYQTKQPGRNKVRSLMSSLFETSFRDYPNSRDGVMCVNIPEIKDWVLAHIGGNNYKRTLTGLFGYSPRLIKAFLRGLEGGDGSVGSNGQRCVICGNNLEFAKQLQVLVAIAGLGSRISVIDNIGAVSVTKTKRITTKKLCYVVRIHRKGGGFTSVHKKAQSVVHYSGKVFCPETEDGIIYVRVDGGKPYWCGNTMNIRAVRHILAMRASEGAEEEIAYVFGRIAKYIVEQEPMLCGDFEQDAKGFWAPKYAKV